jgi:riboflavin kinase / FMN adenylyltransferase
VKTLSWRKRRASKAESAGLVVTVGVFDGVHRGHAEIIGKVLAISSELGAAPACFTFTSNPKRRIAPDRFQGDILALEDKLELLASSGIQICVLADFDDEFASMEGFDFLKELKESFGARALVLGENSRFGRGARLKSHETAIVARSLGMRADIEPSLRIRTAVVSSSAIRDAVLSGRLKDAEEFLGRPFSIHLASFERSQPREGYFAFSGGGGLVLPPAGSYRALASNAERAKSPVEVKIESVEGGKRIVLPSATLPHTLEFV